MRLAALAAILLPAGMAGAGDYAAPTPPVWLPAYTIDAKVSDDCRRLDAVQRIRWTNPGFAPTEELVLLVYPRHRPNPRQTMLYERTFESLRMDSREVFDRQGRRLNVATVQDANGGPLEFYFDDEHDTQMHVRLPGPVFPGETVEIALHWTLDVPQLQGRVGRWKEVTTLLNWLPILAVYEGDRWTPAPFVPWHLSFYNEAGDYFLNLELPACERVATGGRIEEEADLPNGRKRVRIVGKGMRDLAVVTSRRFCELRGEACGVPIKVLAFPEHRSRAEAMLQTAQEVLPLYSEWFGKYPYSELTVAESYFGWNGNQSSGMVLIDERIFRTPSAGMRYVDHLVSHEICHQWWYALVGVDGFNEIWLSESFASYFTKLRMRRKYGPNPDVIVWPDGVRWLPTVPYETLTYSGYYLYTGRGGTGVTAASLQDLGHLHNLFFLVYDRGNRVLGMIHRRLGDERFFEFLKRVVSGYGYRNLHIAELKHELEDFTCDDWSTFFDDWLFSPKICDWAVADVTTRGRDGAYCSCVKIRQKADIAEPVEFQIWWKCGRSERVLLDPRAGDTVAGGVKFRNTGFREWTATFESSDPPTRVELDPDRELLDANLGNNAWHRPVHIRFTPIFTPLDEVALMRPLDEPSIRFGPNVDMEGRFGLRGALIQGSRYRLSSFVAYEQRRGMLTAGVDSEFFNTPIPNVSLGARYEHTLTSALYDAPTDQGKLFARWYQAYTSSLIYPHLAYGEAYFRFGDNFFPAWEGIRAPVDPRIEDFRSVRAFGLLYHLDTRFPYWNPEKGFALDANGELGVEHTNGVAYQRVSAQAAAVRRLPDELGYLSDFRVAGRLAGGYGSPDNAWHFRLGGPMGFRGQRSEDTRGNAYWLASGELRFPLLAGVDYALADNLATWKSLYGSVFYDVGEMWLLGASYGVDHAVGVGLYFDMGLLSFVERVGLRVEYGHSLRQGSDVVWFGLHRAF